jgi:nitrate reductase alpha subunit
MVNDGYSTKYGSSGDFRLNDHLRISWDLTATQENQSRIVVQQTNLRDWCNHHTYASKQWMMDLGVSENRVYLNNASVHRQNTKTNEWICVCTVYTLLLDKATSSTITSKWWQSAVFPHHMKSNHGNCNQSSISPWKLGQLYKTHSIFRKI